MLNNKRKGDVHWVLIVAIVALVIFLLVALGILAIYYPKIIALAKANNIILSK